MRMNLLVCLYVSSLFLSFLTFSFGGSLNYLYTGSPQSFTVPENVTSIQVQLWGDGGAWVACAQPSYAYVETSLTVSSGDVLWVYVGGMGQPNGIPGFNGGGNGSGSAYGGNGASDIRTVLGDVSSRIVVAAGGGGVGYHGSTCYPGGLAGCGNGSQGSPISTVAPYGGFGATQVTGGAGGQYSSSFPSGGAGSLGLGGTGAEFTNGGGGGGGKRFLLQYLPS